MLFLLEFKAMSNSHKTTKTYSQNDIKREWRLIDAEGKILGRLATEVANALRGKDKAEFSPNQDIGDFVIVINAEKIKVTGDKENQKLYYRHSQRPGSIKAETLASLRKRRPEEVIRRAVEGMLPHNRLSDRLITKLKIYAGAEHPHAAQLAAAQAA